MLHAGCRCPHHVGTSGELLGQGRQEQVAGSRLHQRLNAMLQAAGFPVGAGKVADTLQHGFGGCFHQAAFFHRARRFPLAHYPEQVGKAGVVVAFAAGGHTPGCTQAAFKPGGAARSLGRFRVESDTCFRVVVRGQVFGDVHEVREVGGKTRHERAGVDVAGDLRVVQPWEAFHQAVPSGVILEQAVTMGQSHVGNCFQRPGEFQFMHLRIPDDVTPADHELPAGETVLDHAFGCCRHATVAGFDLAFRQGSSRRIEVGGDCTQGVREGRDHYSSFSGFGWWLRSSGFLPGYCVGVKQRRQV